MSCCALKRNLRQCRNWSMVDTDFCYAHRNLTPKTIKKRWLKRYIRGTSSYPIYTISYTKQKSNILHALQSGRIVLTAEDIRRLPPQSRYADIYLLLIEHHIVQPGVHPHLEKAIMGYYYFLLRHFPHHDLEPAIRLAIQNYLILYSGKTFYNFLYSLSSPMDDHENLHRRITEQITTFLDSDAAKEFSWYPHSDLDGLRIEYEKHLGKDHAFTKCLVQRWLPDIKELYVTEKAIQKIKMDQCKEEIMMVCWHPSRIEKYLSMGIEPADM